MDGKSLLINAENGSGKTLAFLLPILNSLYVLRSPERAMQTNHFTMDRHNENEMFQNAAEIYHFSKKNKTIKNGPFKGAVVLSLTKELINQVYV
jgi:superfamily II DNA/RNA helicase